MDVRNRYSRINLQKSIAITKAQKYLLLEHASKCNPNESCAILFGSIKNEKSIVKDVFLAENIDDSPVNFTISNEELLKAYKFAEKKNLEIVGIFHSHPNSDAFPSITDTKFMDANPVPWIISSGKSNEFKAFLLEPNIIEIPIVIS